MKQRLILISSLLLLLAQCNNHHEYSGFKYARHGIYYQLHKIGEDTRKPRTGDFVTVDLIYKTLGDSVFFMGRRKFQISKPDFKGAIDECFMMLAEKENATFIISADDFFKKTLQTNLPKFINEYSKMKVTIEIVEIQTEKAYRKEKEAFLHWIQDFGDYEKIILKQFLEELSHPALGVNFDPANMILYNQGNPIDAVRTLAPWISHVHIKDACRAKQPGTWGAEVPWGEGEVGPEAFLGALDEIGFAGTLAIEREAGDDRFKDIKLAVERLNGW